MTKYKSKFTGQQIDDGIEYGVRVTQQTFSSAQKQQARENIGAQEVVTDMAKLGGGIGTCSTSSGTALVVTLSGYELVQNGFIAVTFEHDVPANATLNINSKGAKTIIYKGSAITADTIKADDTALFSYDGTNYVLISSGGSAAPVNPNETVNISLTQVGGNSADLTGASITITDDDSGDTLYTATWAGTMLTTEIDVNTNYTVLVDVIAGYASPTSKSYTAQYQTERNIGFNYIAYGAYVEATDGTLYTSSNWNGSGKTANSVVLITSTIKRRISLVAALKTWHVNNSDPIEKYLSIETEQQALANMDGSVNTAKLINFAKAYGSYSSTYAPAYCEMYTFPDGVTKGYMPSLGEAQQIGLNYNNGISACLTACGGNLLQGSGAKDILACDYYGVYGSDLKSLWLQRLVNGRSMSWGTRQCNALPIAKYE